MSCLQYICHLITGSSTAHSGDAVIGGLFPSGMKSKILVPLLTSSTAVAESDTDKMKYPMTLVYNLSYLSALGTVHVSSCPLLKHVQYSY